MCVKASILRNTVDAASKAEIEARCLNTRMGIELCAMLIERSYLQYEILLELSNAIVRSVLVK